MNSIFFSGWMKHQLPHPFIAPESHHPPYTNTASPCSQGGNRCHITKHHHPANMNNWDGRSDDDNNNIEEQGQ